MNVKHYLLLDNISQGPYTLNQLRGMWQAGQVTSETLHHMDGYAEWHPLEIILEDLEPPALASAYRSAGPPRPVILAKSRGVYVLLGLFVLGLFGAHNFYAGRYFSGVLQLVITLLTAWLVLPLLFVAFWVILECCLVTRDGSGQPLA